MKRNKTLWDMLFLENNQLGGGNINSTLHHTASHHLASDYALTSPIGRYHVIDKSSLVGGNWQDQTREKIPGKKN